MPKFVLNCTVSTTQGRATFDPVTKILLWDVGKIDPTKLPNMRGQIHIQSGATVLQSSPSVNVSSTQLSCASHWSSVFLAGTSENFFVA